MKKILTILLALAMLASGVAAAEGASNEVDFAAWGVTLPIVDQGVWKRGSFLRGVRLRASHASHSVLQWACVNNNREVL